MRSHAFAKTFVRRLNALWVGDRPPSRTTELLQLPENSGDTGLLRATILKLCNDENNKPSPDTYANLLRQCSSLKALSLGQLLHEKIIQQRFDGDTYLGNHLVKMYGSCGDIDSARRACDRIKTGNVFTGNVMIAAYAQNGHLQEARETFDSMKEPNVVSWNSMVASYAQHGNVYEARRMFDRIPDPNVVSWNSMIAGYAQNGYSREALRLFKQMDLEGVQPNKVTFVSVLDACGNLGALREGMPVYEKVVEGSYEADTAVGTALINMFGKCGEIKKARDIFHNKALQRNAVTWTTMVSIYAHNGMLEDVKRTFESIPRPSTVTWNVLMSAYAQHGHITEVQGIFDRLRQRDDVSWSTLVGAYAQNERPRHAMELFKEMDQEGFRPTRFTYMNAVDACGRLSALREGRILHSCISTTPLRWDTVLQNGLANMYGRCGSVEDVRSTFLGMQHRDSVSWSIVISALAHNGHGDLALQELLAMNLEGATPDELTFVSVLSVCAHAGLLKDGRSRFMDMIRDYRLTPVMNHYLSMLDLLCRSGKLAEAEELLETMPFYPPVAAWTSLLAACKMQGELRRATEVGRSALAQDPETSAPYALLSNVYADARRINEVRIVRKAMEERGLKKQAGCSYIEVFDKVHEFRAGEVAHHPMHREIVHEVVRLMGKMSEAGYVPDTRVVTYDLEEEDKETVLSYHSEKLAIGLGVLSTPARTELRVVKNLRVCSDCHAAIKFMSKVTERRIVVRDCNRFHHFEGGKCSCNDYW